MKTKAENLQNQEVIFHHPYSKKSDIRFLVLTSPLDHRVLQPWAKSVPKVHLKPKKPQAQPCKTIV